VEGAVTPSIDEADAALAQRIESLERRARRDRILALGALALMLATAQAPAPGGGPAVVRGADSASAAIAVGGLVVRDAAGATRLDLGIDERGEAAVDEYDSHRILRQTAFLTSGAPSLRQFDATAKMRDSLELAADGSPKLHLYSPTEKVRMALFIGDKGLPEIDVNASNANTMAYLSADDDGPYLVMRDANQGIRVYAGRYSTGAWGLDVRNAANTTLFGKP
jgi:hypothetical protein